VQVDALILVQFFETHAASCTETLPCSLDAAQKARVAFHAVVKPVILGLKADKNTRGFSMPRDYNLMSLCLS
jgi:hypothetical protein